MEKTFLPDYPVNEYGISLRAMRCLEITESVCQLRDLIDLSMRDKLGPVDAMRKFAAQFREMQSGRPMAQTGAADANGANQPPSANAAQTPSQVPAALLVPRRRPHREWRPFESRIAERAKWGRWPQTQGQDGAEPQSETFQPQQPRQKTEMKKATSDQPLVFVRI